MDPDLVIMMQQADELRRMKEENERLKTQLEACRKKNSELLFRWTKAEHEVHSLTHTLQLLMR